jgi:hypothetical protein
VPPGPGVVEGGQIPYLPGALEQKRKNFAERQTADPRNKCYPLGVPRACITRNRSRSSSGRAT